MGAVLKKLFVPLVDLNGAGNLYSQFYLKLQDRYGVQRQACHVRRKDNVLGRLMNISMLKVTENSATNDMLFTSESAECLGYCVFDPMAIMWDDLTDKLKAFLGEYAWYYA